LSNHNARPTAGPGTSFFSAPHAARHCGRAADIRELLHRLLVAAASPAQGLEADQDTGNHRGGQDPLLPRRRHVGEIHLLQRVPHQREVRALSRIRVFPALSGPP